MRSPSRMVAPIRPRSTVKVSSRLPAVVPLAMTALTWTSSPGADRRQQGGAGEQGGVVEGPGPQGGRQLDLGQGQVAGLEAGAGGERPLGDDVGVARLPPGGGGGGEQADAGGGHQHPADHRPAAGKAPPPPDGARRRRLRSAAVGGRVPSPARACRPRRHPASPRPRGDRPLREPIQE